MCMRRDTFPHKHFIHFTLHTFIQYDVVFVCSVVKYSTIYGRHYIYFADNINITYVCAGQTEKYTVKFMLLSVRSKKRRKNTINV